MAVQRAEVTNILPDGQLWVREVLDDGTIHRRVVVPGDAEANEPREEVKAAIRRVHEAKVVADYRAERDNSGRTR